MENEERCLESVGCAWCVPVSRHAGLLWGCGRAWLLVRVMVPMASERVKRRAAAINRRRHDGKLDPQWTKLCQCPEGDNWRFEGSTQVKCPRCAGYIWEKDMKNNLLSKC